VEEDDDDDAVMVVAAVVVAVVAVVDVVVVVLLLLLLLLLSFISFLRSSPSVVNDVLLFCKDVSVGETRCDETTGSNGNAVDNNPFESTMGVSHAVGFTNCAFFDRSFFGIPTSFNFRQLIDNLPVQVFDIL
tara:strand:+ start:342 stop:737 length:396 start_codon:yes stop_codon:yes gene_type:complete